MADYVSDNFDKIQNTPGGKLCQVFGANDNATCSVAIVKMDKTSKGIKHYHDNITEIYIFAKGKGKIIINEHENVVVGGECYIIPPHNIHYIEALNEMDFVCICTPPWEEKHEFATDTSKKGSNILEHCDYGVLQILGDDNGHDVRRLKIKDKFVLDDKFYKFRRVYYFVNGTGTIVINEKTYKIQPGLCFEVNKESSEIIIPNGEVDFVSIYDKF